MKFDGFGYVIKACVVLSAAEEEEICVVLESASGSGPTASRARGLAVKLRASRHIVIDDVGFIERYFDEDELSWLRTTLGSTAASFFEECWARVCLEERRLDPGSYELRVEDNDNLPSRAAFDKVRNG